MRTRWFGLAGFVILAATTVCAPAEQPVQRDGQLPRDPLACRQLALKEIQEFLKIQRPHLDPDEHISRGIMRRFHEVQVEARLALAFTGEQQAIAWLIQRFDLNNPDGKGWADAQAERFGTHRYWAPNYFALVRALEPHRPELARKTRERMMMLWRPEPERDAAIVVTENSIHRLSLAELKQQAEHGNATALLQWGRLEPNLVVPRLFRQMNDKGQSAGAQFDAAAILAKLGDRRGLDWLQRACQENTRGCPGAVLLESGKEGADIFFQLIEEQEKKNGDQELPAALARVTEQCSDTALLQHLPRLLQIKDPNAAFQLRNRLRWQSLPARNLAFLIDCLKAKNYEDSNLFDAVRDSLAWKGPADRHARQLAELWVDELHQSSDERRWAVGATIFLRAGLGSREIAANAARQHLKPPDLACDVLAEVGRAEDAALMWEATHMRTEPILVNWYERPSLCWLPIIRLTNHLQPAGEPK
jgi:hypothetical protein